jgi:tripartite-type tricarboxylate transporter receptor subunit TctC
MMSADLELRETPDGYTLLLATGTHAISPNYFKTPYQIERNFAMVSLLGTITFILSVNPSLPVKSVDELLARAKAKPGEINYTSGGNAGPARHDRGQGGRFRSAGAEQLEVPAKVPAAVVGKLHEACVKILKLPDVQERIAAVGFDAVGSTLQAFTQFLKAALNKWARVAIATGAKSE